MADKDDGGERIEKSIGNQTRPDIKPASSQSSEPSKPEGDNKK